MSGGGARDVRAIGFDEFGGPEVLHVVEIPAPHPGPGEVRVRVRAATVNPTDTGFRSGGHVARMSELQPPFVPGMDAAGEVDEVGDGVDWRPGDAVMAVLTPLRPGGGAYAEEIVVPADSVARMPEGADFVHASTLPMNGLTARLALDLLALEPGQLLGVTGAPGAVGGYTIQLAKADGLVVVADASEADEELVRLLGADVVVRRGNDIAERMRAAVPEGVDGLVDGAVLHGKTVGAIRDGGSLAVLRPWDASPGRGVVVQRVMVREYLRAQAALDRLRQQVEDGVLTLRVARTFAPEEAPDAHRRLERGGTRGRLVLEF